MPWLGPPGAAAVAEDDGDEDLGGTVESSMLGELDATEHYEFVTSNDATPAQMPNADSLDDDDDEESAVMRLDLGSLDVEAATTPSWSASGDDPLIIGDELQ